ncbi:hypothetical protein A7U60_g2551 [Sanghuangporus baumii]|uniref:Uncharacterized protein n=1 Tax=Sanghuangporus baumii TaxID=108892 RepID=A0A9Q5I2B8_SANBA|nr:hypothetical protein A7U60_g2551 [Sanghuangporus baumii]
MVVTRRMAKQAASANTHTSSNTADNDDRSTNVVIGRDTAGAVANVRASSRRRGAKDRDAPKAKIPTEDSTVGILPLSPVRGSQTNKRRRGRKQTECTNRRATAKIGGSNGSANMNSPTTSDNSPLKQVQKRRMESETDKENIACTAHDATASNERRVRQRVDKAGDDAKDSVYIQDTSSAGSARQDLRCVVSPEEDIDAAFFLLVLSSGNLSQNVSMPSTSTQAGDRSGVDSQSASSALSLEMAQLFERIGTSESEGIVCLAEYYKLHNADSSKFIGGT